LTPRRLANAENARSATVSCFTHNRFLFLLMNRRMSVVTGKWRRGEGDGLNPVVDSQPVSTCKTEVRVGETCLR
jgi:hypothetical protein